MKPLTFFQIVLLSGLFILISCSESKETPITSTIYNCSERLPVTFDQFIHSKDSNFVRFYGAIDSINDLIKEKGLFKTTVNHPTRFMEKQIWFHHNYPIKIAVQSEFLERDYLHEYYVLDECYWMHELRVFYDVETDSLMHREIQLFKDTSLQVAVVEAVLMPNSCIYTHSTHNKYTRKSSESTSMQFLYELKSYAY